MSHGRGGLLIPFNRLFILASDNLVPVELLTQLPLGYFTQVIYEKNSPIASRPALFRKRYGAIR